MIRCEDPALQKATNTNYTMLQRTVKATETPPIYTAPVCPLSELRYTVKTSFLETKTLCFEYPFLFSLKII